MCVFRRHRCCTRGSHIIFSECFSFFRVFFPASSNNNNNWKCLQEPHTTHTTSSADTVEFLFFLKNKKSAPFYFDCQNFVLDEITYIRARHSVWALIRARGGSYFHADTVTLICDIINSYPPSLYYTLLYIPLPFFFVSSLVLL